MEVIQQLDTYLLEEVESAEERLEIVLSPHSKIYVLHLLRRLCQSDDFFHDEITDDRPLCIILLEALHKDVFQKIRDLRVVGDLSLIFSGLFPEYLTRRTVDIDYYVGLGKKSYFLLSEVYGSYQAKRDLAVLYSRLVSEFLRLTSVLSELSGDMSLLDDSNLQKAHSRWRSTGVRRYLDIMEEKRVFPLSGGSSEGDPLSG